MGAIATLTRIACAADAEWSAELTRTYGRQACNARYDARGTATPALARLSLIKRQADFACHAAWCESRGETPAAFVPSGR